MKILRDRWYRTAFHRYFLDLDPIDRQTFWVAVALALAIAFALTYIAHAETRAPRIDPWFELPPDVTRFAETGERA